MRGEVKLLNGEILSVKRVSPFSLHEGMREKLRFLEDQTKGTSLLRFHRKLEREESRVARMERMVARCEEFISHPDTPFEKREEYFKKVESYEKEIESSQGNVDEISEELISLDVKIKQYAKEVAGWYAGTIGITDEKFDEASNDDVNITIVRALLGIDVSEDETTEVPLSGTGTSSDGPGA